MVSGTTSMAAPSTSTSTSTTGPSSTTVPDLPTTTAPSATAPKPNGAPRVQAAAYAVFDTSTGAWLAVEHADAPLPIGSIMKLLTTYVVDRAGNPTKVVTVPPLRLDPKESAIGLYPGERLPRDVLVRAMLIVSASDAARALAVDVGGTEANFVDMMNRAASELGLRDTVAANPMGLDATGSHSTARDVVTLAATLMKDPDFRATVARPSASLHGHRFPNTNNLLRTYPGADGIKTGHTTHAGYCVVASATRDGRRIIVAVLGAPTDAARVAAASTLLEWAFSQG
jgi:D-alanyl-D-alanine carboxypeptidase (penicillin-binding protein 5/6)